MTSGKITVKVRIPEFSGMVYSSIKKVTVTRVDVAEYEVQESDYDLSVKYTITGSCEITIPESLNIEGRSLFIADDGMMAETNNIIVKDHEGSIIFTIDGDGDSYFIRYIRNQWRLR